MKGWRSCPREGGSSSLDVLLRRAQRGYDGARVVGRVQGHAKGCFYGKKSEVVAALLRGAVPRPVYGPEAMERVQWDEKLPGWRYV